MDNLNSKFSLSSTSCSQNVSSSSSSPLNSSPFSNSPFEKGQKSPKLNYHKKYKSLNEDSPPDYVSTVKAIAKKYNCRSLSAEFDKSLTVPNTNVYTESLYQDESSNQSSPNIYYDNNDTKLDNSNKFIHSRLSNDDLLRSQPDRIKRRNSIENKINAFKSYANSVSSQPSKITEFGLYYGNKSPKFKAEHENTKEEKIIGNYVNKIHSNISNTTNESNVNKNNNNIESKLAVHS